MGADSQPKRWARREPNPDSTAKITQELKVSETIAAVLVNRGLSEPEAAHKFLHPKQSDLHDPFLMADMRNAVDRIMRAVANRDKVLVYGDYDVDGTTSTIVLKRALSMVGADVSYYIPERLKDGYGLNKEAMDRALAEGFRLIISVDTGIRAHEIVDHARQLGLDIIVTDHHLPEAALPAANAVLNPKRSDCCYPNKNLAGVGVAFKLVQALLQETGRERYLPSFMKIAAIGTIADIVPLVGENRVIAKFGLQGLSSPKNAGLRALLKMAGLERQGISSPDIAFKLAPRINAMGRMAGATAVVELFDAPDMTIAMKLATEIEEQNLKRQKMSSDIIAQVMSAIEADPEVKDSLVAVVAGEGWHRGVIGIAASRVIDLINRPAIVISIEDGVGHGSARSIPGFHLLDAMASCGDLFERFGGHAQAAGLAIQARRIPELRRRINQFARGMLNRNDLVPLIEIDSELPIKLARPEILRELKLFEPFGCGNPEPVFETHNVEVVAPPKSLKDKHLKLRVMQGGRAADCLWWGEGDRTADIFTGDHLSLAFTLAENDWSGFTQVQLNLRDVRLST
jgi:single-stranded-DNA-specific exonuclease